MDFSKLTVVALRKLAKDIKLRGYSRLRKAELIKFIIKNTSGQTYIEMQVEEQQVGKEKEELCEESCSICLENIEKRKKKTLKCKHTFHNTCVNEWLKVSTTCPVCRNQEDERPTVLIMPRIMPTVLIDQDQLPCTCDVCLRIRLYQRLY